MSVATAHASKHLARMYARPGFLLRRAHQISAAVFEDECKSVGLTPAQFGVLTVLHSSPGLDGGYGHYLLCLKSNLVSIRTIHH